MSTTGFDDSVRSNDRTMSRELTSTEYWNQWWSSEQPLDDPIPAKECQFGSDGYFLRAIERNIGPIHGKSVVELGGCMSNRLLAMVKWRDVKATIVDYSPIGIERSRRFMAHNGCASEFLCCDFFAPELDGRKFDVVTHWGVLEHQIDPLPLIRRCVELTRRGGYVVFSMPQLRGPGAWLWKHWSPNSWARHIFHTDDAIITGFLQSGASCNRLFFGPLFIQIEPCETPGWLPAAASFAQFWINQFGRLKCIPFDRGLPFLSENRAFVAHVP
jgi:2-polyprenyl-3-methyl-5-hydroxy-6-metoxy-1,4-benzoquinol methylase